MALIKPRLTDYHSIHLPQTEVDFAIPFFDEDLPLYLDPFLLWKSPSLQDQALHAAILNIFNFFGQLANSGQELLGADFLVESSECEEVGLGHSPTRRGKRFGKTKALEILKLFHEIPEYGSDGFSHFEEIQFYIDGISKDRISDIACNLIKSFLIDFTIDQCRNLGIPLKEFNIRYFNYPKKSFVNEKVTLPSNPVDDSSVLVVPKRWLRATPWISFDDYFKDYCPMDRIFELGEKPERVPVLNFNRHNYGVVQEYVQLKEKSQDDCNNDPLFTAIPVTSAKRKLSQVVKLPTGKKDNADKTYEDLICQLFASLLYPHLDFACEQSRTESNILIRDLIFYNTRSHDFFKEIFDDYDSKQIVFEIKNVQKIEREHINQLNRYMADELGRFGVLITRNPLPKNRLKNTIDLWSGQRRCIITLTDEDLAQMVEVFESKQRLPLEVIIKKYVLFRRACPG